MTPVTRSRGGRTSFTMKSRRRGALDEHEARTKGARVLVQERGRPRTTPRAVQRAPAAQQFIVKEVLSLWLPAVLWAAVIFALSSIPGLTSGLDFWDLLLRKAAHVTEFAILGALLARALGHSLPAVAAGVAYAIVDEIHQSFVPDRAGVPLDVVIDTVGVVLGVVLYAQVRERWLLRRPA